MTASFSQWLLEPYGAPTSTSEVNCIPDFYRVEALTAFGASSAVMATEAPETASAAADIPMEILPDIAARADSGSIRPAV
jgi:hypothetical protein